MSTEQSTDRRASHIRGLTVTSLAALAGIAAGLVSAAVVGTTAAAAESTTGLYIVGAFVLVQFGILRLFGVDVSEFSTKDYLYVAFMTFVLWFVSWTILLTSNTAVSF